MKDMVKIYNRMINDLDKADYSTVGINSTREGIIFLAEQIAITSEDIARDLFIKYGVYEAEFIQEKLPMFYPLIVGKVQEAKEKKALRNGASQESIERQRKLAEIGSNRIIGYARVSTLEQNLDRQFKALEEAGCQVIFSDKASGKTVSRPAFKEMMETLKKGDTLIVSELTRLARSTTDLFNMMAEFERKEIKVKSLKEDWLDTTTAHGKFMFTVMSGMAQFERELTLERQQEGIKVAKANGVKFGHQLREDSDMELAIQLAQEGKYTMTQIAKMCKVSRTTLWRRLKDLGIRN